MNKLVLVRHGQSTWNEKNKFTGWVDVGLTERGFNEAIDAGKVLKEQGFNFKVAYTSYLTRAIKTLWLVMENLEQNWIPVYKSWRLNEKHYGMLQGLNKAETAAKYGDEQVLLWRRDFNTPPPPLSDELAEQQRNDPRFKDIPDDELPLTEALADVIDRIMPYWKEEISVTLQKQHEVLVSAHGNSLRAIVMYLKNMSEDEILNFNIPTGIPYVFEFDDEMNLVKDYFLGDEEEIKKKMQKVANQGKSK